MSYSTSNPILKDISITIPYNEEVYNIVEQIIRRDREKPSDENTTSLEEFQKALLAKSIRSYYLS